MVGIHVAAALALLLQTAAPKPQPAAVPKPAATDVSVTLSYTGKGTVDANHKIIVWLFSDPDITSNSRPLATEMTTKNGSTVVFRNAPTTPFYVFAVFDETGKYDGVSGPPPHGLPCALYAKTAKGAPTPVKAGEAIRFRFSDATRWNK